MIRADAPPLEAVLEYRPDRRTWSAHLSDEPRCEANASSAVDAVDALREAVERAGAGDADTVRLRLHVMDEASTRAARLDRESFEASAAKALGTTTARRLTLCGFSRRDIAGSATT